MVHRTVLFELAHQRGNRGVLLPDRDVDTLNAGAFLVDDGIHGNRGLAGLAVADDQLALAAADRNHRIDGLQTGLNRLVDRLTGDDTGGDLLDRGGARCLNRTLAVDRIAQRIHDASEQPLADRHLEDASRAAHPIAFGQMGVLTQDHRADRVALEVQRKPEGVAGELQHLVVLGVRETVHAHDTVGQADDGAFGPRLGLKIELLDLLFDEIADLGRIQLHGGVPFRIAMREPVA